MVDGGVVTLASVGSAPWILGSFSAAPLVFSEETALSVCKSQAKICSSSPLLLPPPDSMLAVKDKAPATFDLLLYFLSSCQPQHWFCACYSAALAIVTNNGGLAAPRVNGG
ncbi:unnamed protein product [Fusarium graminearum]|nr:unnamed protein product [Fusarium graminearum]